MYIQIVVWTICKTLMIVSIHAFDFVAWGLGDTSNGEVGKGENFCDDVGEVEAEGVDDFVRGKLDNLCGALFLIDGSEVMVDIILI